MKRGNGSRLFPLFLILIVIIVVIAAIVSIARAVINNTHQTSNPQPTDSSQQDLLTTTDDHSVRFTERGPIVAQENFQSLQIEISPTDRTITAYTGYLDTVSKTKTLSNNEKAYEEFVYALDKANMMKGSVPTDDAKNDLRGICAAGYVREYAVLVDGTAVKRLWTSTCSGSKGSLQASTTQLDNLFLAQIPNASAYVPFQNSNSSSLHL